MRIWTGLVNITPIPLLYSERICSQLKRIIIVLIPTIQISDITIKYQIIKYYISILKHINFY